MHPTIEEELDGALRLVGIVGDDEGLSEDSRALLVQVERVLGRLRRSWAVMPSFLVADNAALGALLTRLVLLAPGESTEGAWWLHDEPESGADSAFGRVSERNARLRATLADLVVRLPDDGDGAQARLSVIEYLLDRNERRPE